MKHTPTPWRINKRTSMLVESENRSVCSVGGVQGGENPEQTHNENQANAAFIVKACNNHEKLLNLLKKAQPIVLWRETNTSIEVDGLDKEIAEAIKQAEDL